MEEFKAAFDHVIGLEGTFSDDPNDRGGATKYGVTERIARANGYLDDMRDLTLDEARGIAKRQYWDALHLDEIAGYSTHVATELFDTAYNMGVSSAALMLQRSLNALNNGQVAYQDVLADGHLGPVSVSAFITYIRLRGAEGETVLLRALNSLQCVRYLEICEANPSQERFVYGWIRQRVS